MEMLVGTPFPVTPGSTRMASETRKAEFQLQTDSSSSCHRSFDQQPFQTPSACHEIYRMLPLSQGFLPTMAQWLPQCTLHPENGSTTHPKLPSLSQLAFAMGSIQKAQLQGFPGRISILPPKALRSAFLFSLWSACWGSNRRMRIARS
ncbi:hypothetical protein GQ457_11G018720 [Hibiscus cannabinus]